jgi:MFS transporter, SP family, xylose:H+ symportor
MRSSGRRPGARAVLARLAPAEEAEKEISEIRASLSEHHSGKLFSYGAFLIFIGIALSVFQQFVGVNVVMYYATDISRGMGLTTNASLFQTVIVGAINLVFTMEWNSYQ